VTRTTMRNGVVLFISKVILRTGPETIIARNAYSSHQLLFCLHLKVHILSSSRGFAISNHLFVLDSFRNNPHKQ